MVSYWTTWEVCNRNILKALYLSCKYDLLFIDLFSQLFSLELDSAIYKPLLVFQVIKIAFWFWYLSCQCINFNTRILFFIFFREDGVRLTQSSTLLSAVYIAMTSSSKDSVSVYEEKM